MGHRHILANKGQQKVSWKTAWSTCSEVPGPSVIYQFISHVISMFLGGFLIQFLWISDPKVVLELQHGKWKDPGPCLQLPKPWVISPWNWETSFAHAIGRITGCHIYPLKMRCNSRSSAQQGTLRSWWAKSRGGQKIHFDSWQLWILSAVGQISEKQSVHVSFHISYNCFKHVQASSFHWIYFWKQNFK